MRRLNMYIYRNVSRTEFTWNEQALSLNLADAGILIRKGAGRSSSYIPDAVGDYQE